MGFFHYPIIEAISSYGPIYLNSIVVIDTLLTIIYIKFMWYLIASLVSLAGVVIIFFTTSLSDDWKLYLSVFWGIIVFALVHYAFSKRK
jgi:hypothetical protein